MGNNARIVNTHDTLRRPNAAATHQSAIVGATVQAFSALIQIHPKTTHLSVYVENANLRYSLNQGDPTASVGVPIFANDILKFSLAEAKAARLIRSGGNDATIQVVQYDTQE
jgi:hypothetical protein